MCPSLLQGVVTQLNGAKLQHDIDLIVAQAWTKACPPTPKKGQPAVPSSEQIELIYFLEQLSSVTPPTNGGTSVVAIEK